MLPRAKGKAQISSFEINKISKNSQVNLGMHNVNNLHQICDQHQQGPFQNLKFVL